MPLEDFTTATEVDPNNHIEKTAYHIDFYALRNEDALLYWDKGVDHFGTSWEHKIDIKAISYQDNGVAFFWVLSNDVDDYYGLQTAGKPCIALRLIKSLYPYLSIRELYNGTEYYSSNFTCTQGTQYYLTVKRDGTSVTCKIYSDSARTNLLATLSITLHAEQPNHRYIFASQTYNTGVNFYFDCDIENLDLQEGGVLIEKGFADVGGGSDAFINPYRSMGFPDAGHGAEAFNTPFRSMGVSDEGHGIEAFSTPFRTMGFAESGHGSDGFLNPYRAMVFADVGHGADNFLILFKGLGFSDNGHGADSFSKFITFLNQAFADSGHGADAFFIPFKALGFTDVGHGVDVFVLLRMLAFADVGSGTDAFIKEVLGAIAKAFADVGYGSDAFLIPFKAMKFDDAGHGADAFINLFRAMGFSDIGHGTDVFALLRQLGFSDTGYGADAFIILLRALGFSDVSHGTDAFIIPYRAMGFSDSGHGTDAFLIVFKTVFFSDASYGSDSFGKYIPGAVKVTKLFLVIGDLAIQISGD